MNEIQCCLLLKVLWYFHLNPSLYHGITTVLICKASKLWLRYADSVSPLGSWS